MAHDHDRNGCALHGALRLLDSIEKVAPILHASAGCSLGAWAGEDSLSLTLGSRGLRHREVSATLLQEKQVVFGGTSRLREQIKNTVKVIPAELYAVVTGCVPEVIGDDVLAMVKEAKEQSFPIVSLSSPGFSGNAWHGYAQAAKGLLQQVLEVVPAKPDNAPTAALFGLVPGHDVTWEGDLLEIENLLSRVGLKAIRLMGFGQTADSWRATAHSAVSINLSPWGRPAAELLRERFGTPVVDFSWLPVGSREAGSLLSALESTLSLDGAVVDRAKRSLDNELRYYLDKAAPILLSGDIQKRVAVVAGSALAVGLSRFLSGTLGQLVEQVIITDDIDESSRATTLAAIRGSGARLAEISFSSGRLEVAALLRKNKPEVILGSALESDVADELRVPHLEVASPLRSRPFLRRSYVGVRGAVALVEDYLAVFANAERAHRQKHKLNHFNQAKGIAQ